MNCFMVIPLLLGVSAVSGHSITKLEEPQPEILLKETSSKPDLTSETHLVEEVTQPVTVTETTFTETSEEPVFEKKAKTARKLLFDRVKERYYSNPNVTQDSTATLERRKREIDMKNIPEGPRLPKLNYESLPPYLRKLMPPEKPNTRINSEWESDEEDGLDDIKQRIEKMLSKLKTTDSLEDAPKTKPRTYGMNLTDESGYIWNDVTKPEVRYNLEESAEVETDEIKQIPRITSDSESEEDERLDDIKHRMHKLVSKLNTPDHIEDETPEPRTYGMNLTADSGYVWNDITNPRIHYTVEASESIEEEIKELLNQNDGKDEKPEPHKPEGSHEEEKKNGNKNHQVDEEGLNASGEDKQNSFEDKGRKRNKHKEDDDTISQLMDSDKFWNWLADWTSVYIDLLTEQMIEAVQEEVEKQVKVQAEEQKREEKENTKIPDENKNIPEEPDTDKSTPVEKNTETLDKNESESIKEETVTEKVEGIQEVAKPDNDKNEENLALDDSDVNLRRKHKEDKNKKDESPIKDTKLKQKEGQKKKDESLMKDTETVTTHKESSKVEAQNVYGNTIGGEKVTNIFIFYPNQDPNKILQDISKLNDSNGVNIAIRLNKTDIKDEVAKKDESTPVLIEKNEEAITEVTNENSNVDISTTEPPTIANELTSEAVPETTTLAPKTESTTTKSPKITEESTTELVPITLIDATESTTSQSNEDATENESTTESSKVESTTAVGNQDDDLAKQSEDENDNLDEETKEKVENKVEKGNEKHETKENESTNEKSELKDQNKDEIVSPTPELLEDESKPELVESLK